MALLYRVADTSGGYCISAASSSSLHALRDDMRDSYMYISSPGLPHPLGNINHGPANVPDSRSGIFRGYGWVFGFWHVVEVELLLYIYISGYKHPTYLSWQLLLPFEMQLHIPIPEVSIQVMHRQINSSSPFPFHSSRYRL